MEVAFGSEKFIKSKFDSLDGKTIVEFNNQDSSIKGRAAKDGMSITFHKQAQTHEEAVQMLELLRDLIRATWEERLKLKPKLERSLSGH